MRRLNCRGNEVSDLGDDSRAWNYAKKAKKLANKISYIKILIKNGVDFEVRNNGVHLIVTGKEGLIDYWPSTGKFIVRGGETGRGIRNLLTLCKTTNE